VWNSTALRFPTRFTAARYLGATLEVNAQAELLIRKLFSDRTADMRLLYAAVEGIANPNFSVSLGREQAIAAPPHFRPNFAKRQQLLDALAAATVDEELQARIAQAREDLLARWSRAAAPGP
jgi:hypothetical protein